MLCMEKSIETMNKSIETIENSMKTIEKSMTTLGKSMNAMENRLKPGKIDEQCQWHMLASKFSNVQVFAPECSN